MSAVRFLKGRRLHPGQAVDPARHLSELFEAIALADDVGLGETRLIREVASTAYARRIREDFRNGGESGANGTPTCLSTVSAMTVRAFSNISSIR
jgi:hypothetical protein